MCECECNCNCKCNVIVFVNVYQCLLLSVEFQFIAYDCYIVAHMFKTKLLIVL